MSHTRKFLYHDSSTCDFFQPMSVNQATFNVLVWMLLREMDVFQKFISVMVMKTVLTVWMKKDVTVRQYLCFTKPNYDDIFACAK